MHEKGLKKWSLRDSQVRDSLIYTYFPVLRESKQASQGLSVFPQLTFWVPSRFKGIEYTQ